MRSFHNWIYSDYHLQECWSCFACFFPNFLFWYVLKIVQDGYLLNFTMWQSFRNNISQNTCNFKIVPSFVDIKICYRNLSKYIFKSISLFTRLMINYITNIEWKLLYIHFMIITCTWHASEKWQCKCKFKLNTINVNNFTLI